MIFIIATNKTNYKSTLKEIYLTTKAKRSTKMTNNSKRYFPVLLFKVVS